MRTTIAFLVAAAAAGGALLLPAGSASARPCPDGTYPQRIYVTSDRYVTICMLETTPCDPGPCDPTAMPPKD